MHVDTYFFISVEYEIYNKTLSLYFILSYEQFPTFVFSEYKHDFSLMFILNGGPYKCLLLLLHSLVAFLIK